MKVVFLPLVQRECWLSSLPAHSHSWPLSSLWSPEELWDGLWTNYSVAESPVTKRKNKGIFLEKMHVYSLSYACLRLKNTCNIGLDYFFSLLKKNTIVRCPLVTSHKSYTWYLMHKIYIYVYHYRRQGTCFLMDKYNSNGLGGFS